MNMKRHMMLQKGMGLLETVCFIFSGPHQWHFDVKKRFPELKL